MERTEHRGADELYRYYEVYETIGSGDFDINDYFTALTVSYSLRREL